MREDDIRTNRLFREIDRVLVVVRLDIQHVVTDSSDCSIKICSHGFPLGPLGCVPVGVLSIPESIQRVQSPRKQSYIREIVAFVALFFVKQPAD